MDSPPYICILTTRSLSQGPIEVIDEAFRLPFLLPRVRMTQRESSQRLIHPFERVYALSLSLGPHESIDEASPSIHFACLTS